MITAHEICSNYASHAVPKLECFAEFDGLDEALSDIRRYWLEEPDNRNSILLLNDAYQVEAILSRHCDDPEICIVTFIDGDVEEHRCRYVLSRDGRYERTEVVELA